LIEPILWNYILDNDLEEGKEVDELSSDEEDDSVVFPTPPEPPYSVAASMTPVKSATLVDNGHIIHLTNSHILLEHLVMKMVTLIQLTLLL
jgi:hypothetical protein